MIRSRKFALLTVGVLLLGSQSVRATNAPQLSEAATVSLLTLWPGNEIYLAFGHSALRVRDPQSQLDLVFNYGTFDFRDPLFVPKFVKGYLNYYLACYPFALDFEYDKRTQNRTWHEQVLNLNPAQVNSLYAFLLDNSRPEKRYYRYDFILDNCATRIRDALLKVLGSDVTFDPRDVLAPHKTFRQMIGEFVSDRPFYGFMFYFVLGMASDARVTSSQSQFLPLSMMKVFDASTVQINGRPEPLVRSDGTLYRSTAPAYRGKRWADPALFLWPCTIATLLFTFKSIFRLWRKHLLPPRGSVGRILDFVLFLAVGVMGSIAFYLTVFSVHAATRTNLAVVWFLPTNLIAAFYLVRKRSIPRPISLYFVVVAALCVGLLLAWPIWPQPMHPAMIPLMLLVAARAFLAFLSRTPHDRMLLPTSRRQGGTADGAERPPK